MKEIEKGKFELLTTKEDAIDKFMQMQGVCREAVSGDYPITFYCGKKGNIIISRTSSKRIENTGVTDLLAEVVEQDGKTYVTYRTRFSKSSHILKTIALIIDIIVIIFAIIFKLRTPADTLDQKGFFIVLILGLGFFVFELLNSSKENETVNNDSAIMVKELEKRVNAISNWDK